MKAKDLFVLHNKQIAADGLGTQGARVSATMILTLFARNIPISEPEGLNMSTAVL